MTIFHGRIFAATSRGLVRGKGSEGKWWWKMRDGMDIVGKKGKGRVGSDDVEGSGSSPGFT